MTVLLNTDISKRFQIAPNTVKNWINQTITGKLNFDLAKVGEKMHIKNTPENIDLIHRLKHVNARFKPKKETLAITPTDEFYHLFNDKQIIDLIHSIETYNYIPVKYSYFGKGATVYFNAVEDELQNPSSISSLEKNQVSEYLIDTAMSFVRQGYKINLIEIGHDYSTFQLIDTIKELKKLDAFGKYISVSASEQMNKIRLEKVKVWTKHIGKSYQLDFEIDNLKEMLFLEKDEKTVNLCLALSSCLGNSTVFNSSFHALARNLNNKDFLIISESLYYEENSISENSAKIMKSGLRQERYDSFLDYINIGETLLQGDTESFGFYNISSQYKYFKQKTDLIFKVNDSQYILNFERMQKIYYFILNTHKLENLINIITPNYLLKNLKIPYYKRALILIGARENTTNHY